MPDFANPTETVILALVLWALLLLVTLGCYRTLRTATARKAANSFDPAGQDMPPFGQRLTRAHANAYEFLPFALAVLLFAVATGQSQVTDGLALPFLAFRIGQSLIHIISTSVIAVLIRFVVLFIPQIAIIVWWCVKLF